MTKPKNECAPSEDSDQIGHPPSLIRVFAVHIKNDWVLSYPLSAQRRLWSDWEDVVLLILSSRGSFMLTCCISNGRKLLSHMFSVGNRSLCTQVISCQSHFVPFWSFRTILVISYPLLFSIWSFRIQFGHFVPISYPVWSFRTYYYFFKNRFGHSVPIFYCFVPKSFRTRSHFVLILVISYPLPN